MYVYRLQKVHEEVARKTESNQEGSQKYSAWLEFGDEQYYHGKQAQVPGS